MSHRPLHIANIAAATAIIIIIVIIIIIIVAVIVDSRSSGVSHAGGLVVTHHNPEIVLSEPIILVVLARHNTKPVLRVADLERRPKPIGNAVSVVRHTSAALVAHTCVRCFVLLPQHPLLPPVGLQHVVIRREIPLLLLLLLLLLLP